MSARRHSSSLSRTTFEPLEGRTLQAAGALDPSFSGDGLTTIDFGNGITVIAADVAVQGDGKTVVVGRSSGGHFAVARFNLDGTPDTSFGPNHDGKVLTSLGSGGLSSAANAVAIQPDGKIVVVGSGWDDTLHDEQEFAIARYNIDGSLDNSFDGDGKKRVNFGFYDAGAYATAVAIQSDGRIVVGGASNYGWADIGGNQNEDFAVIRLNTNGSLDGSFDDDGKRIIGLGAWDGITNIAMYGSKIVLGGRMREVGDSNVRIAVMRLNSNGGTDDSFDGDGNAIIKFPQGAGINTYIGGMLVQSGGQVVVAGTAGDNFVMARLTAEGPLDSTFGGNGNGWVSTDMGGEDRGDDIIFRADGGFYVGGVSTTGLIGQPGETRTAFAAYTSSGLLDTSFGDHGKLRMSFSGTANMARGSGRRFVCTAGGDFQTARMLDSGANLVSIGSFDPVAHEAGQGIASFLVTRSERLPTPLRVYIDITGTARRPGMIPFTRPADFTCDGMHIANDLMADRTYVDIPANETFVSVILRPVDDAAAEGDEAVTFTLMQDQAYDVSNPYSATIQIIDNDVAGGPTLTASNFNYESGPKQTLTFNFNQDVSASIDPSDFSLNGPSGAVPFSLSYDIALKRATLTLDSDLPDGNFTAQVNGAGITNSTGTPMGSTFGMNFFFMNGDANRDRRVDIADLAIVAGNWQEAGRTFSQGDFNHDSIVNIADLAVLAGKWQQSVPGVPAVVSPFAGGSVASTRALKLVDLTA